MMSRRAKPVSTRIFSRGFYSLATVGILVGCGGATSTARVQGGSKCGQQPVVGGGGTAGGSTGLTMLNSNLDLASNLASVSGDAGVGTGYLDISTKSETGVAEGRRCTMHVRPIEGTDSVVRIWTAGHCFFDPQTPKFRNSTYKAQIYYNGGYFSAGVVLDGMAELATFSQGFATALNLPGLDTALPDIKGAVFSALPSQTGQICLDNESAFVTNKISSGNRKMVACFARSELRGFRTTLTLDSTTKPYMTEVLKILRAREKDAFAKMDAKTALQIKSYIDIHFAERRRTTDLRSLAFSLNKQICEIFKTNPTSPLLAGLPTGSCQTVPLISATSTIRDLVIAKFKDPTTVPATDNKMMEVYYDDGTTSLDVLKTKTAGCNTMNIDSLPANNDLMTPCDMTFVADKLWQKWVDSGAQPVVSGTLFDANLFGFNPDSYFALHTNAAQTALQKSSGLRGKARILPLNNSTVLNFGTAVSGSSNNIMHINLDSAAQSLFPTKGDSGSMLSIFGYFPVGLLSTVDGERTSGGASVTPLPEVGSEDETTINSASGC